MSEKMTIMNGPKESKIISIEETCTVKTDLIYGFPGGIEKRSVSIIGKDGEILLIIVHSPEQT